MTRPPTQRGGQWPSSGEGRSRLPASDDDGWGPSTAVYSASATAEKSGRTGSSTAGNGRTGGPFYPSNGTPRPTPAGDTDTWAPAGPLPGRAQRAVRAADHRTEPSAPALTDREPERGLTWWAALIVLLVIAGIGGIIDSLGSISVRGGFNVGIIVASIVAILLVKRSHMFPVVIAPPIVYSGAALFQLYIRSSGENGLHKRQILLDAAANYLVYGFPAIAASSAAVLIIAGIRLITRK